MTLCPGRSILTARPVTVTRATPVLHGQSFQEKFVVQNVTLADGQRTTMVKMISDCISISYFLMNNTGNCQLETKRSVKAMKPGETGEKLVGRSSKLMGNLPHLLHR